MENSNRRVGTVSRGIRCPIIREGDNLAKIVADSVIEAAECEGFELRDRDVISVTESIVARAQGNYASVNDIATDVKNKLGGETIGVIFPILSRNRFAICLRGIAMAAKKIVLMLSYPSDEVGNELVSLDKLDEAGVNPYSDVLSLEKYRELFGENVHEFTGVDYVQYYGDLIREAGAEVEIIFANEYIYQIYIEQGDTVNAVASIKKSIDLFPEEPWFMQNLINLYINSGQEDKAIEYLDIAIAREPHVGQYYNSKGSILARIGRFEESFKAFEQAIAIEPNNALFLETLGFAYVDLGNKLNDEAAYLDAQEYAKAKVEIDKAFNNALPYFEKAYELEPDNNDYKRSLRSLYYRLGMNDKYEALAD